MSAPPPGFRRAIFIVCIAGIFLLELRTIDVADVRARVGRTFRSHDLVADRLEGTDFIFDRRYGMFLDDVARHTGIDARIRLCAPESNELYDYTAAYLLAPRTVERAIDGDFLAAYECPVPLPAGMPLRFGVLIRQ